MRGYRVAEVEDFLEDARTAYSTPAGSVDLLDSGSIRRVSFGFERGGYSVSHVDAALERLEDAFASRERETARSTMGDEAWFAQARDTAKEIVDRLSRPSGAKFSRVVFLSKGYDAKAVDAFASRLLDYFQKGLPLSVGEVRTETFRLRRGGYREAQVDHLLDVVVEVMLAVR